MKKGTSYIILIFIAIAFSSCGKKAFDVEPTSETDVLIVGESISINGIPTTKKSDVYSTSNDINESSSSFLLKDKNNSSLTVSISNNISDVKLGAYSFDSNEVNIDFNSAENEWSSSKGHQKGAYFEVLSTERLASNSGYVKEMIVKAHCFLYNSKGEFIPFECTTSIKF